jgi:hypothetical protein
VFLVDFLVFQKRDYVRSQSIHKFGTGRGATAASYAAMNRTSDSSSFALAKKLSPNGRPLYRSCPIGAVAMG